MGRLLICHGDIYTSERIIVRGTLLIEGGTIVALGGEDEPPLPVAEARTIDARGLIVAPGFIDLQVNGAFGHDFTRDPSTIPLVAARLPETGVTAFLPTVITSPPGTVAAALEAVQGTSAPAGAIPLGLHLEGPYLSPARAGAHEASLFRSPTEARLSEWEPLERVRLVTLAPELEGASALIDVLLRSGVHVAAGHSDATYDQAMAAFGRGVTYVTHLFNAMPPLHHRQPGLAGAALDDGRVAVGVIADGIHLHPAAVRLAYRAKGPQRITLVTDAMAAMGQPGGRYCLGEREVIVDAEEGSARLSDGRLAGSILTMDAAVRNLIAFTGCSLNDALKAASTTPARAIGLGDRKGVLAPGYDADIVLLTPDLRVAGAIVGGASVTPRTPPASWGRSPADGIHLA